MERKNANDPIAKGEANDVIIKGGGGGELQLNVSYFINISNSKVHIFKFKTFLLKINFNFPNLVKKKNLNIMYYSNIS